MVNEINVPTLLRPEVHPKQWGQELWLFHCSDYTAKFLDFNAGAQGSLHFHVDKHESWHLLEGEIEVTTIDTDTAAQSVYTLRVGEMIDIPRLCPHQVKAIQKSRILEVSTQHSESDSYRVSPGDSQRVIVATPTP